METLNIFNSVSCPICGARAEWRDTQVTKKAGWDGGGAALGLLLLGPLGLVGGAKVKYVHHFVCSKCHYSKDFISDSKEKW